jgi:hypothetical protein
LADPSAILPVRMMKVPTRTKVQVSEVGATNVGCCYRPYLSFCSLNFSVCHLSVLKTSPPYLFVLGYFCRNPSSSVHHPTRHFFPVQFQCNQQCKASRTSAGRFPKLRRSPLGGSVPQGTKINAGFHNRLGRAWPYSFSRSKRREGQDEASICSLSLPRSSRLRRAKSRRVSLEPKMEQNGTIFAENGTPSATERKNSAKL